MSLPSASSHPHIRADWQAISDAEAASPLPAFTAIRPQLWEALHHLGFSGGQVLVQGDGADGLLGRPGSEIPGIATISATVGHPSQSLPREFRGGLDAYDAVVGVLPMADVELNTLPAVVERTLLHATLAWASLRMVRPGGLAAIVTNHMTLDGNSPRSRVELEAIADLVGAVRLPSAALRPHMPGTDSVTDILLFCRRGNGQPSRSRDFVDTVQVPVDGAPIRLSTYFDRHPEHVLGQTGAIHRPPSWPILTISNRSDQWLPELRQAFGHIAASARHDGIAREPAGYVPGMGVLSIHHETKTPHVTHRAEGGAPRPRGVRRAGPDALGPSMN